MRRLWQRYNQVSFDILAGLFMLIQQLGWTMQIIHNSTGGRVPKFWRVSPHFSYHLREADVLPSPPTEVHTLIPVLRFAFLIFDRQRHAGHCHCQGGMTLWFICLHWLIYIKVFGLTTIIWNQEYYSSLFQPPSYFINHRPLPAPLTGVSPTPRREPPLQQSTPPCTNG
jgi:hypothetical protein